MNKWEPISLEDLFVEISNSEPYFEDEQWNFWQLIKISPEKWSEKGYGDEGGGFWVVAICGTHVIWYNDIEEGFNISKYKVFGEIDGYFCNQDELNWTVNRLFDLVKFGGNVNGQAGPPKNIK